MQDLQVNSRLVVWPKPRRLGALVLKVGRPGGVFYRDLDSGCKICTRGCERQEQKDAALSQHGVNLFYVTALSKSGLEISNRTIYVNASGISVRMKA